MGFKMLMITSLTIDETFLEYGSLDKGCLTCWCEITTTGSITGFQGRLVSLLSEKWLTDALQSGIVKICNASVTADDLMSRGPFQTSDRELNWRQYKEQSTCQINFLYSS